MNNFLISAGTSPIEKPLSLYKLLKRPEVKIKDILRYAEDHSFIKDFSKNIQDQAEVNIKYKGYIDRELLGIKKFSNLEQFKIKDGMDYFKIKGLTFEAQEKLSVVLPETLGQASRIAGVSPSDISILMIYLRQK